MRMGKLLSAVVVVSVVGGAASAESWTPSPSPQPQVYITQDGPRLNVHVYGAQIPPNDAVELRVAGDPKGRTVSPLEVKPYAAGNEPMAIMFVMSGQEIWVGNNSFETDPNIRFPDTLGPLERAIDRLDLAHRVPAGSLAGIVTYATGAKIRMPLEPVDRLHGASFGVQRDYYNQIGLDLVQGIEVGLTALEATAQPRKLLVVIGDGNDTDSEKAAVRLLEQKKRAAMHGIRVETIIFKSRISDEHNDIRRFDAMPRMVLSPEALGVEIETTLLEATQIFYATFDARSLPVWNQPEPVDLVLRLNGSDLDPVTMVFPSPPSPPPAPPWWKSLWMQTALGAIGIGLLVVLARRAGR